MTPERLRNGIARWQRVLRHLEARGETKLADLLRQEIEIAEEHLELLLAGEGSEHG